MRLNEIIEEQQLITMWHGGRELQYSYHEMRGNKSKQMEYGPGLYLTNYYETARKYAKGGGKTFLVTFTRGTNIKDVAIETKIAFDFLNRNRFANKKALIKDIMDRYGTTIPAETLLNLMVNLDSMTPTTSAIFRQFLVENGADYLVSENYGGWGDQTIVVIFNPKIITQVKPIAASEVALDMRKLPVNI